MQELNGAMQELNSVAANDQRQTSSRTHEFDRVIF
jgi:hypothetical protein